jgi:hypothetical protein
MGWQGSAGRESSEKSATQSYTSHLISDFVIPSVAQNI